MNFAMLWSNRSAFLIVYSIAVEVFDHNLKTIFSTTHTIQIFDIVELFTNKYYNTAR